MQFKLDFSFPLEQWLVDFTRDSSLELNEQLVDSNRVAGLDGDGLDRAEREDGTHQHDDSQAPRHQVRTNDPCDPQ